MAEEHVEFVANSRTTVYTGGGGPGFAPGQAVHLPKSHAEALDHLHMKHEIAAAEKNAADAAKAAQADTPKSTPVKKSASSVATDPPPPPAN